MKRPGVGRFARGDDGGVTGVRVGVGGSRTTRGEGRGGQGRGESERKEDRRGGEVNRAARSTYKQQLRGSGGSDASADSGSATALQPRRVLAGRRREVVS